MRNRLASSPVSAAEGMRLISALAKTSSPEWRKVMMKEYMKCARGRPEFREDYIACFRAVRYWSVRYGDR